MSYDTGNATVFSSPLLLVQYEDHGVDLKRLVERINGEGKTCVLWSPGRGFSLDHQSKRYALSDDPHEKGPLSNPRDAIRFIISKAQNEVYYVLEDFHHLIGAEECVHPEVGEIRAVIKEMARSLQDRKEKVFFLVPASYSLPSEMVSFFHLLPGKPKSTPGLLEKYGLLLTEARFLARAKPVVGAEAAIDRVIQILSQMETNNPLLVGHPGVGKSAVVEGFARALFEGRVPEYLKERTLYRISLNSLVAGTKYRGQFEERLEGLMTEVLENKNRIIVFIDEIHTLLSAGSAEGSLGAGEALKPVLARGEFPCIGATTIEGARHLLSDRALARRFKQILVKEPSPDEAFRILTGIAPCFEEHHALRIEDRALMAAVYLSRKYLTDEYLPGKAIALLDAAAAYCRIKEKDRVREEDIIMEMDRIRESGDGADPYSQADFHKNFRVSESRFQENAEIQTIQGTSDPVG